jgi:hypothetical protein
MGETAFLLFWLGRVDEAREIFEQVPEEGHGFGSVPALPVHLALVAGDIDRAQRLVAELQIGRSETDDLQDRMTFALLSAFVASASGDHTRALETVTPWLDEPLSSVSKLIYEAALTAAAGLGRDAETRAIIDRIDAILPGIQPPSLRCLSLRFRARLGDEPDDRFRAAAALSHEYGMTLVSAQIRVEHAEWLLSESRAEEADELLADARAVFARVDAKLWLERIDAAAPVSAATTPTP